MEFENNHFKLAIIKLIYAFAYVDGNIAVKEIDEIKLELSRSFDQETFKIIELELRFQEFFDQGLSAEEAFIDFRKFYLENKQMFTEQLKSTLFNSSSRICESNNKKNKSELRLLVNLDQLFKS